MKKLVAVLVSVLVAVLVSTGTGSSAEPVHIVGAGDIASAGSGDTATSNEILRLNPASVFTLGDNAYPDGTSSNFSNFYNPTWGRVKALTKPSPGNHDYRTSGASGYFGYFGTASYYRYEVGGWSIYSLNSNISRGATSPQVVWLKNQLASDPNACILAYWHHPRYSSGTHHGSNTSVQTFWDALAGKAELVLNGHEHNYERFAPRNGITEIVVGTGGVGASYGFGTPLSGSVKRITGRLGVIDLALTPTDYSFRFMSTSNTVLDSGSGTCA